MSTFAAKTDTFQGPLDVLLDLIQREDLEITQVSLATITDQYIQYIEQHPLPASQISSFLMIAAELILIKSKVLLPDIQPEEEEPDGAELERRLRVYQKIQAIARTLATAQRDAVPLASPQQSLQVETRFEPPVGTTLEKLHAIVQDILTPNEDDPELTIERRGYTHVPLEHRVEQIHQSVQKQLSLKFSTILEKATSRHEVIVSFLAILELLKQQLVRVRQDAHHAEIVIEHHE